jgi:hypothetical protein
MGMARKPRSHGYDNETEEPWAVSEILHNSKQNTLDGKDIQSPKDIHFF